jgi:nucleoside-diphosphate-sugar epimerase
MGDVNLLCFGYGYVAQRFHHYFPDYNIQGTSRYRSDCLKFSEQSPIPEDLFQRYRYFLISIPPDPQNDVVLRHHRNSFLAHKHQIQWIGYLSATSVYGDYQENWVTENAALSPQTRHGQARLRAESQWLEFYQQTNLPIHIFRLSGIYGPQRNVLKTINNGQGQIIHKPNHVFSRIHVDDICQVIDKSMHNPNPGSIYNVADDGPASSADVMTWGYRLLNRHPPLPIPVEDANLSPQHYDFYRESKKINNHKIKQELGIILHYPSYKEGLKHCLLEDYGQKIY